MNLGKFKLGETVYLITDNDQLPRLVTGYVVRPNLISYYLSCGTVETSHYDFEISHDKNYNI